MKIFTNKREMKLSDITNDEIQFEKNLKEVKMYESGETVKPKVMTDQGTQRLLQAKQLADSEHMGLNQDIKSFIRIEIADAMSKFEQKMIKLFAQHNRGPEQLFSASCTEYTQPIQYQQKLLSKKKNIHINEVSKDVKEEYQKSNETPQFTYSLEHKYSYQEQKIEDMNAMVHEGFGCDGCKKFPIVGYRYCCQTCEDFDFCDECYESDTNHTKEHEFKKIKGERRISLTKSADSPIQSKVSYLKKCDKKENPIFSTKFLKAMVLNPPVKQLSLSPGEEQEIQFVLLNSGELAYPDTVFLQQLKVLDGIELSKTKMDCHLKPDEVCHFQTKITAKEEGTNILLWRLQYTNPKTNKTRKFGPTIKSEIIVTKKDSVTRQQAERLQAILGGTVAENLHYVQNFTDLKDLNKHINHQLDRKKKERGMYKSTIVKFKSTPQ